MCHVEVSIQPSLAPEDFELLKTLVQLPCSGLHRSKCLMSIMPSSSFLIVTFVSLSLRVEREMSPNSSRNVDASGGLVGQSRGQEDRTC